MSVAFDTFAIVVSGLAFDTAGLLVRIWVRLGIAHSFGADDGALCISFVRNYLLVGNFIFILN
jgi:hypothetical protein